MRYYLILFTFGNLMCVDVCWCVGVLVCSGLELVGVVVVGGYVFFGLNHFDFGQNFTFYIVLESIEIANEKLILKGLKK